MAISNLCLRLLGSVLIGRIVPFSAAIEYKMPFWVNKTGLCAVYIRPKDESMPPAVQGQ